MMLAFLIQVSDVDRSTGVPGRGSEKQSEVSRGWETVTVGPKSNLYEEVSKEFLWEGECKKFCLLNCSLTYVQCFACLCEMQERRNVSCLQSDSNATLSRNVTQSESICLLTCSISLMAIKSNCNVVGWNKVFVGQIGLIHRAICICA